MTRMMTMMLLALVFQMPGLAAQEGSARSSTAATTAAAPINLNTATVAQLESLPGVGRVTAERIVEYREMNGEFKKVEELMNVRGVGEKSFLTLRPLITVSAPGTEPAS